VRVSLSTCTMSTVEPSALVIFSLRYLPSPSWVMPRMTGTPRFGTSSRTNLIVLFSPAQMASERSLPTFAASMSKAAENSMSETW
jgi:hypothetical protein